MGDIRQTRQYASYLTQIGWRVKKTKGVYIFLKKFPLIGYFAKVQRPSNLSFLQGDALKTNKYRMFQIVIEPKNADQAKELEERGYRKLKSTYLPSKTLILDLRKTKKELFIGFKKDARHYINKNEKLHPVTNPDVKTFHASMKKAVSLIRYTPMPKTLLALKQAFKTNCQIIMSHNLDSGAIFLSSGDIGYYWIAFTDKSARGTHVQYSILWQGILWAKEKGCKYFDFEGIYDPRYSSTSSWKGFSTFKAKFGGQDRLWPPTYSKTKLF